MRSYPCVFKHRTCGLTIRNWDLSNRELGFTMGHHGSKMRSHRNWCEFDRIVVKAPGNLALSKSHGRWIRRQGTTMMNHEQSCRYEPKSEGLKPSDQPICGAMTLSASLNRCLTLSIFQDCQTKETSNAQKFWVENHQSSHFDPSSWLMAEHNCKRTGVVTWSHGNHRNSGESSSENLISKDAIQNCRDTTNIIQYHQSKVREAHEVNAEIHQTC